MARRKIMHGKRRRKSSALKQSKENIGKLSKITAEEIAAREMRMPAMGIIGKLYKTKKMYDFAKGKVNKYLTDKRTSKYKPD
tara:strand:+ start:519 stop:764 length:246 start_codon:yes stop_codon:yes gene_type:complete